MASMESTVRLVASDIVLAIQFHLVPAMKTTLKPSWSTERLISVDHVQCSLSYEIVDNDIGFKSYVSTVKIVPEDNEGENQSGCVIEWGFTVDPVEGWLLDDLVKKYDMGLQRMAKRMKDACNSSLDK
ncbi:hypothetical protein Patl1_14265 [Pistacia atlantica]|uniref:Uncharacterized protein n=1 Tax=Pistacia atlantica TaxID=434234 RepID=A0ACC1AXS4_9ROSI|nr:hypothetical protein Patl1_14265 [Pistacia atlantica]